MKSAGKRRLGTVPWKVPVVNYAVFMLRLICVLHYFWVVWCAGVVFGSIVT